MSPLRWTVKSTRTLARELNRAGHRVVPTPAEICCGGRLQPAGPRQDNRGQPACGPRCPVPLSQRADARAGAPASW
ncbi:hypothetical protein [Streptomyces sp. ISL-44]|uniref:hypothetical protein n=1 Tax=Streptomyces sp. ISL-44 TaxID=2819184 RepID=UPI002034D075|nr:hypothetical protein [Streptomyces sp. ISL-44]